MHATIFQPTAFQAGAATGDPVAERMRATWTTGDFGRIAVAFAFGAAEFVARLGLARGERVLDVACGTGNLTLPASAMLDAVRLQQLEHGVIALWENDNLAADSTTRVESEYLEVHVTR